MANIDVLEEKWRMWFDSLDVNKTGVLTPKTWTDAADVLIEGQSLAGDDADRARRKMTQLGETVLGGTQSTMTQKQFTENLSAFFQKDKNQALEYITSVLRSLCEVMDTDNDSLLDEGGFVLMCRAFGHSEDTARSVFNTISGDKSQLSIDCCVQFWTDVWFSADNEKWEKVLAAIQ